MTLSKQHSYLKIKLSYQKKNFNFQKKKLIEKMDTNMEKKMLLKMAEIYITKTYKKLRSYPNRERINNYISKKFMSLTMKKFFSKKNNV